MIKLANKKERKKSVKMKLGDRMKKLYENRFRFMLPCRTYTLIRVDGKSFHSFTKGLDRPFDEDIRASMVEAAKELFSHAQGAKLAYVQSDEISLVLTDFDNVNTDAWFDNNLQKICSVSASIATLAFNKKLNKLLLPDPVKEEKYIKLRKRNAFFDSRVWSIGQFHEVKNYFLWRHQDAVKNSITLVASGHYSHKELDKKSSFDRMKMIEEKGDKLENYPSAALYGTFIFRIPPLEDGGRSELVERSELDFNDFPFEEVLKCGQ